MIGKKSETRFQLIPKFLGEKVNEGSLEGFIPHFEKSKEIKIKGMSGNNNSTPCQK